jgi:hypothetical protein
MELHNLASLTQNLNMTRLFRGVALEHSHPKRIGSTQAECRSNSINIEQLWY